MGGTCSMHRRNGICIIEFDKKKAVVQRTTLKMNTQMGTVKCS